LEGLVALSAEDASVARVGDPLDADLVANFEVARLVIHGDDIAGTLVSSDEGQLVVERPVSKHGVQVSVADTGVLDSHKRLAGLELLRLDDWDLLNRDRSALLVEDGGLLSLGDVHVEGHLGMDVLKV